METGVRGARGACAAEHVAQEPASDRGNVTTRRKPLHLSLSLRPY